MDDTSPNWKETACEAIGSVSLMVIAFEVIGRYLISTDGGVIVAFCWTCSFIGGSIGKRIGKHLEKRRLRKADEQDVKHSAETPNATP